MRIYTDMTPPISKIGWHNKDEAKQRVVNNDLYDEEIDIIYECNNRTIGSSKCRNPHYLYDGKGGAVSNKVPIKTDNRTGDHYRDGQSYRNLNSNSNINGINRYE